MAMNWMGAKSLSCWVNLQRGMLKLPVEIIESFGVSPDDHLLVLRGSNVGFICAKKGAVIEKARVFTGIPVFENTKGLICKRDNRLPWTRGSMSSRSALRISTARSPSNATGSGGKRRGNDPPGRYSSRQLFSSVPAMRLFRLHFAHRL